MGSFYFHWRRDSCITLATPHKSSPGIQSKGRRDIERGATQKFASLLNPFKQSVTGPHVNRQVRRPSFLIPAAFKGEVSTYDEVVGGRVASRGNSPSIRSS